MRVLRAARDAGVRRVVLTSSHRGGLDPSGYARAGALSALQGDRRARAWDSADAAGKRYLLLADGLESLRELSLLA